MAVSNNFVRFASPNEQRTVSREDLGFYHAVVIGATYELGEGLRIDSPRSLVKPLTRCIEQHPFLGVVVGDRHTEKAYYERVDEIDLENHIEIVKPSHTTTTKSREAIQDVLRSNVDRPFSHDIPPWRLIILPLSDATYFIAFAWSHMLGDGLSGFSLHRSLLAEIRASSELAASSSTILHPPHRPLGLPLDTSERLPISWGFLLGPLMAVLVPTFLANWLGLKAQVSTLNEGTWTGTPASFDAEKSASKVVLRVIDAQVVEKVLREAKNHDARLTGVLHQFLARAMSKAFGGPEVTDFVSQTAVNMRKAVGVPSHEMGEFVTAAYLSHPKRTSSGPLSEEEWAAARHATSKFAEAAVTLQDQPIGLLRYLPSMRKWTLSKLGQRRDCSHEVSNVGAFEDEDPSKAGKARITQLVFGQPGHVLSAPICFNVSSVKKGPLAYTVTWPTGALGIDESDEEATIASVCDSIDADFAAF
ncbi:putative alcohol acetyltransferase FCK4 [Colletotrichum spinosum]|uniref:Putative alcohol acetyltransferase FCK4 n=1 Tax=Colletotrichum spinosum TaxID=1347390 RepID=A0A4R8QEV9_9PEZI|nr:putative alcohol acetyltransferase FCK4 [Colletotrichum spinosum]